MSLCQRMWQPVEEGKSPEILKGLIRRMDGTEVPVEVTAAPFKDGGEPACQVVLRDKSDWEQAREEVRRSRDQLKAIANGVGDFILAYGPDGSILSMNDAVARSAGFPSVPIHGPQGGLEMVITTITDVAALKIAQRALEASEARFRTLTEAAFEAIAVISASRIMDANPAMATLFGYSHEELLGKLVLDLIDLDSRPVVRQNIEAKCESTYEVFGLKRDGTRFPLEIHGKSSPDGTMLIQGMRDSTLQKNVIEEQHRLFSLSNDMLAISDLNGRFVQVNSTWKRSWDIPKKN